jgi:hypothetical protein
MRRVLVLALVVFAAALPAATTHSAPAGRPVQVHCSGGMVFLFWPKGHKSIPSADLGSHPAPHVDIYKSSSYKGANLLGFVNQKGKSRFSSKCNKSTASAVSGGVPRNKIVTKRAAISCGDVGFADVRVSSIPAGTQVDLGITGHKTIQAVLKQRGSRFIYDNEFCRVVALPH